MNPAGILEGISERILEEVCAEIPKAISGRFFFYILKKKTFCETAGEISEEIIRRKLWKKSVKQYLQEF